ncbi:S53 family peptidase [Dictyobacter kobayashii]|uniref:Pseudomonapepsin n=1 Tax=Dictyobacter kobayashii TaxID=2014872 RepID=A0A402ALY5_9CHLR|nr:S53 family peptidase [Dictyobacter kobayashii]GCE20171.1 pseudomonapepsin [Dictyobacter kobayashii]
MKNKVGQQKRYHLLIGKILAILIVLSVSHGFLSVPFLLAAPRAAGNQSEILPGHLIPLVQNYPPIGPLPEETALHLSIGLALRNQAALNTLLAAQANPASVLYHHYLTPQAFKTQFGPTSSTVNLVVAYLHNQGLHVESVASNNLFINASGSAALIEKTFSTTLNSYDINGRLVYAPTADPSVPATIAPAIQTIAGLDNVAHYHPLSLRQQTFQHASSAGGYTPAQLRSAYDVNPLLKAGAGGTGQTVALFELDGYLPSDINTYRKTYNLGVLKGSPVLVNGATNTPGPTALEVEVDMEMVSALAPGATQKIYIGSNSIAGINNTYNRIVTDNAATVISTSWGECENASGKAELEALHNIFKQGAAQGQSFFAASGDTGAYDCNTADLAVDSPADDPYVVGVGGTHLNLKADNTYLSESAWSDSAALPLYPRGFGSGGGISTYFNRPDFQRGPNVTNTHRMVPDVSANADPNTGNAVYCTVSVAGCSSWVVIGGTSVAAPLWAGLAADINHYLMRQKRLTLGNITPTLYRLYTTPQPALAYHDIIRGNNLYYPAGVGYDLATGLGTPDAWNITIDLTSACSFPTKSSIAFPTSN